MDYSQEQKEKMFKSILTYVAESKAEEGITAKIKPSTIDMLTGMKLDENIVINRREELNKNFGHLSASYGFKDFYDFYLYAMSCEEEPLEKRATTSYNKISRTIERNGKDIIVDLFEKSQEYEPINKSGKSKKKDFSKLKKVKRTVTRNGKPTEMTFYEDPNKEGGDGETTGEEEPEDTSPQPVDAKELRKATVGDINKRVSTKELNSLKDMHTAIGGNKEFNADADTYQVMADEHNNIMGMVGFSLDSEYVTLVFEDRSELVSNYDSRLFMELVKEGLRHGLGIRTQHLGTRTFDIYAEDMGMDTPENITGYYTIDGDKLLEAYGYGE